MAEAFEVHLCELRHDVPAGVFARHHWSDTEARHSNEVVVLPCGHYTLGEAPYKFLDGYHIVSFFVTKL